MVERAARTLHASQIRVHRAEDIWPDWDHDTPEAQERCRVHVRTVIAAMREPTEAMQERGAAAGPPSPNWDGPTVMEGEAEDIWRAMIDQALR